MAKNRTKSINNISDQADRLKTALKDQMKAAYRSGDRERYEQLKDRYHKVWESADRYTKNITKQKADINAVKKADDLQRQGRYAESFNVADKADNRQWSQATYMGKANSNG